MSICIPSYNGEQSIRSLIDHLLASKREDLEVVISDDNSSDDTWQIVSRRAVEDPRLRVERNAQNVGMDRNFARTVQLAKGDYVWLCGQDDMIEPEGIERVMAALDSDPGIDFVFMNHAKRELTAEGETLTPGPATEEGVEGFGVESFLQHTGNLLPTFLPTYLIKRSRWNAVSIENYLGTCYCQVGVFLEQPEALHWYHFPGTHVTGLQPLDGWQSNAAAYTRIALGHFAMLWRARARAIGVADARWAGLCLKQGRRLIYALILWRHKGFSLDTGLVEDTQALLKAVSPTLARLFSALVHSPRFVSSALYTLVGLKRRLRTFMTRSAS
ncbi:glycosyltransferase family 2 protein [Denitromonas ohlonensis]|uniref:glycosyltransferase family 2 protein n=1 Tax=Denitromonas ohlonensis TaxID=3078508 RepID=UPI001C9148AE|nr:glycosyltransferase [Denitromonas ohlonensis]